MTRVPPGVRGRFPALRPLRGRPSVAYLDSACMSLVPEPVLRAMNEYYTEYPGCAGRSVHRFAGEVSQRFEAARERFARFFGVPGGAESVVFVKNATEAINLVANGLDFHRGDRVLVSDQEHNSNLVPWQRLRPSRGVGLEVLALPDREPFDLEAFERALERRPRLVTLFHASNLDGRVLPAREIVARAHDRGALVLLDGCQAAPHRRVDLGEIGADFYALSAHKMLGPTGTGALLGTPEALSGLRPVALGGETVEWSTQAEHALRGVPHRFEAGLQNYAGILGAAAALDFLEGVGLDAVEAHDRTLNERLTRALADQPRLHPVGPAAPKERPSIFAFSIEGVDAHVAALFLDEAEGVMVRSGRHCVHSWYEARGAPDTIRASFYLYNTASDVDRLIRGVNELLERVPASAAASRGARARPGSRSTRAPRVAPAQSRPRRRRSPPPASGDRRSG